MLKPSHATGLMGGVLGLVTFALPWVADRGDRYTPYTLIADTPLYGQNGAVSFLLLWLVPVGACIVILCSLLEETGVTRVWTIIGSVGGLSAVVYTWLQLGFLAADYPSASLEMSVGGWLAALAFIITLIAGIRQVLDVREEARQEAYAIEQRERQKLHEL